MSVLDEFGITLEMLKEFEYLPGECLFDEEFLDSSIIDIEGCLCEGKCSKDMGCSCCSFSEAYNDDGTLRQSGEELAIMECTGACQCSQTGSCWNSVVQRQKVPRMTVENSGSQKKRYGVIALEDIQERTFVGEYTGVVLPLAKAQRCFQIYSKNANNYLFCVEEFFGSPEAREKMVTCIDATMFGNATRFFNHSCDPNLDIKLVRTGNQIPRIAFFSNKRIPAGDELCYDYGVRLNAPKDLSGPVCECKAVNCFGRLPFSQTLTSSVPEKQHDCSTG